ncbi:asparagine synthase (glutamine-hydrolyzing) [uncultured Desulfuromusa sp.]|uniref:asparagine synthase (glutamine-hydrolyzing) n=1 Tax=uncultured Desulfuromusa sp. TaxID=219183 RepID=UPI002AA7BB79|nr:asparagine synthase (glutamine-hydrolyzing) [uncultured Desulfuromusa sp.]
MCGIAGYMCAGFPDADISVLKKMGQTISHRGPDASGEYIDEYVALGHQRLSIVDLSSAGAQPMTSLNQRYVIVFNGEIYNFLELRSVLESKGVIFRSRTDTEVILTLFETEGPSCLQRLNGMFALAIWDKQERSLFIARDRIGKKPLYYYHDGRGSNLAFASEIKALLQIGSIPKTIDQTALLDYMAYLHIPAPKTIYKNIYKLLPGHYLQLNFDSVPIISEYWDVLFSKTTHSTFNESVEELLNLVSNATASRMISDVPLGAFLSGGVDSSLIVGLMSNHVSDRVKTCSIGFSDKKHDESAYARQVADIFKTDHREYFVTESMVDTIKLLPKYFDEPFADSSAIPTYHVSRLAKKFVTVALSGDGGDETFGGYDRYVTELVENVFRENVPSVVLNLLNVISGCGSGMYQKKLSTLVSGAMADPAMGFYKTNSHATDHEMKLILSSDMYSTFNNYDPSWHIRKYWDRVKGEDHMTRMSYTELKSTLPDGILVKVDRMSMANSLEVRSPLLDYRVIELAGSMPSKWKINRRNKKVILKEVAKLNLPSPLINRKKQGFTVPLDNWFRNELKPFFFENVLNEEGMRDYFDVDNLKIIFESHLRGSNDYSTLLWMVLSFSLWWNEYISTQSN